MTFKTKATGGKVERDTADQIKLSSHEFVETINGYTRNQRLRQ